MNGPFVISETADLLDRETRSAAIESIRLRAAALDFGFPVPAIVRADSVTIPPPGFIRVNSILVSPKSAISGSFFARTFVVVLPLTSHCEEFGMEIYFRRSKSVPFRMDVPRPVRSRAEMRQLLEAITMRREFKGRPSVIIADSPTAKNANTFFAEWMFCLSSNGRMPHSAKIAVRINIEAGQLRWRQASITDLLEISNEDDS